MENVLPKDICFAVDARVNDEQLNLIRAFSINPNDCIKIDYKDIISIEKLLYISSPVSCARCPSDQTQWLSNKLRTHFDLQNKKLSKRVLISREKAAFRRTVNHIEIENVLGDMGFESYILEDLSISEQAHLFAESEIVVGPHGAGFANLYFADPRTKIAEWFPNRDIRPTYYALSNGLELDYICAAGDSVRVHEGEWDVHMSPEVVVNMVERLMNKNGKT